MRTRLIFVYLLIGPIFEHNRTLLHAAPKESREIGCDSLGLSGCVARLIVAAKAGGFFFSPSASRMSQVNFGTSPSFVGFNRRKYLS